MIKNQPGHDVRIVHYQYSDTRGENRQGVTTYNTGSNVITYGDGSRLPSGHWPWKECTHVQTNKLQPVIYREEYSLTWPRERYTRTLLGVGIDKSNAPAAPTRPWNASTVQSILNQLDLNSNENVLLYSGVVQAVPLLGSVFRLNSILRRLAKRLSKEFRKKPFTTVLKSAISLDFVDRFVISPMLDDARKFQDATDYVLRVIQTARERNSHRFALSASSTELVSEEVSTSSWMVSGDLAQWQVRRETKQYATSKAFMLLEARYDMMAVDPIKIWAQRVGLTRPLDSVWDLVPFSFVVDYFTRAGDFISHLSDKMSDVDGLRGKILAIHDLWGTLTCKGIRTTKAISAGMPWHPNGSQLDYAFQSPGTSTCENTYFQRFRVGNPWQLISSLQRDESWGKLNLSLSSTRKRTIAELIIQAKL